MQFGNCLQVLELKDRFISSYSGKFAKICLRQVSEARVVSETVNRFELSS
jgi:hypothetical protein